MEPVQLKVEEPAAAASVGEAAAPAAPAVPAAAPAARPDKVENLPMLVVLYGAAFVSAFNENLVNVALVDIMAAFGVGSTTAQWLVTGYMVVTSIVTVVMPFLMQRFRLRTLFYVALACFLAGQVVCMLAPVFPLLLAFRLLQAVGSGVFIPLMMNAVLAMAPPRRMGTFLAIGGACITLGPAFAPVVSGVLATLCGWRLVFAAPAVVAAAFGLVGAKALVSYYGIGRPKLDVPSLVLVALGLTLVVYGLGQVMASLPVALVLLAAGAAAVALFARRQGRTANPLLNLHPVALPRFAIMLVLVVVTMMMSFSTGVLLPVYLESAFGHTALVAGALLLPAIVVSAATSVAGGRVMDAFGVWPLLPVGFGLAAAGQLLLAYAGGRFLLAAAVLGAVAVYAGTGAVMSPMQASGLVALSEEEHAHGVAIINTLVMVAASIGPALFVGILSAGEAGLLAQGAAVQVAAAGGFTQAILAAAGIAIAGFALALGYAWRYRRRRPRR